MSKKEKPVRGKKRGANAAKGANVAKGVLEITRSGVGFVVVNEEGGDILVRPNDFNTALNGDTVRVEILKENLRNGRKEGKITELLPVNRVNL